MSHINFSNKDLIKLILQFFLENGLLESFFTLSSESGVNLNWVESANKIETLICKGQWSELIELIKYIKIPENVQVILFEHIVLELLELKEPHVAQHLMENKMSPFYYNEFKEKRRTLFEAIERSKKIISDSENASVKSNYSSILSFVKNSYIEGDKEKSRERLSKLISENLVEIKKSMLLEVIGDYLRYKSSSNSNDQVISENLGLESTGNSIICSQSNLELNDPKNLSFFVSSSMIIDIEKFGYLSCITFCPTGEQIFATSKGYIIIGSVNLRDYTKKNFDSKRIYSHSEEEVKVLGLCVSGMNSRIYYGNELETERNSIRIFIASTSERGDIKVWDYSNSNFIFLINAYEKYITDFTFNKDATCILSSSIEGTIKIHGLKSKRTIKYFPKNGEYFVNKVSYNNSETMVISALSNGSVQIWEIKSSSCIAAYDICSSQILELKLVNNFNTFFSILDKNLKRNVQTLDSLFIRSKSGMYIVDVSNGEVINLEIGESILRNTLSATFNSKMNIVICLQKNNKIIFHDIGDRCTDFKEIKTENLYEYEQLITDQLSGKIAVAGKNKFIILSNKNQTSNHIDTDSNISFISSDSKL